MAARGKSDHADAAGIEAVVFSRGADQAHGALGVLERHVAAIVVALMRQAVDEHEDGDTVLVETFRTFKAFLVQHDALIAAARDHQHGGAGGGLRFEDEKAGAGDAGDETVADDIGRFAALDDLFLERVHDGAGTGRNALPQKDFRIRLAVLGQGRRGDRQQGHKADPETHSILPGRTDRDRRVCGSAPHPNRRRKWPDAG
jgi:hypothetical protein